MNQYSTTAMSRIHTYIGSLLLRIAQENEITAKYRNNVRKRMKEKKITKRSVAVCFQWICLCGAAKYEPTTGFSIFAHFELP